MLEWVKWWKKNTNNSENVKTKNQSLSLHRSFPGAVCAGAILFLAATMNVQAQYNYTTLNVPGAANTWAYGISGNNVVGTYLNGGSHQGFLYNGSSYTTLSVPGASSTEARGISGNNIVGIYCYYPSGYSIYQGFLYNGSSYTTLSVPGAMYTLAYGISDNNIVGTYMTPSGDYHGFLYDGSSYTTLNVPGATDTYAQGIDGNNIVGWYRDASDNVYGFLATPVPEPSALAFLSLGATAFLMHRRWRFVAAGARRPADERTIL